MVTPEASVLGNASDDFVPGDTLGRYQLLFAVGEGGMARVWLGRMRGARGFDQLVAVKVLLPAYVGNTDFEQMFIDEARLASRISHAHVVKVLDTGEERGRLYLVLEWLEGVTFAAIMRRVRRRERLPIPIAVRLITQACSGLHATHQLRDGADALLGVVHGDVSPQNLIVTYDGSVKLIDFGVAFASATESSPASKFVAGKPSYMAPEQRRGEGLDRRTDVYALGIVLYKLTTGAHPFQGARGEPSDSAAWSRPALPPRAHDPLYPEELEAVVLRTLALDPAQRMKSADELAKALEALPHQHRSATDEDVAEHIRQWFAAERRELRERIESALARASLLTPMPSQVTAPGVEVGIHGSSGGASPADGSRTPLTSLAPWEATAAAALARRPWKPVAGVAAAIALALFGFVAYRTSTPVASGPLPTAERRATAARAESPTSERMGRESAPAPSSSALPAAARGPATPKAKNSWRAPGAPAAASVAPPAQPPSLGADVPKNWRLSPGF
jgi:serine/threonine-protein kinase